ncbi:MAG: hypothetical protein KY469_05955, partial [Actinobacteria bacterium]|nr:hypothetical protein [Actinomycetota bacterium]
YLSGTHRIPRVDGWGEGGPTEQSFRCYPLRGDCLAYFARRSGPRLFMASIWAGILLAAAYLLFFRTVPLDTPRRAVVAAALAQVAVAFGWGLFGLWIAMEAMLLVRFASLVWRLRGESWTLAGDARRTTP